MRHTAAAALQFLRIRFRILAEDYHYPLTKLS